MPIDAMLGGKEAGKGSIRCFLFGKQEKYNSFDVTGLQLAS